jgi:hypothetical protein
MFSGLSVAQEPVARRWTTLTSFTLQAALVAAALVLPILHPENLPEAFANRRIFVPASNAEAPRPATPGTANRPAGRLHLKPLIVNRNIVFHPVRPQEETNGYPAARTDRSSRPSRSRSSVLRVERLRSPSLTSRQYCAAKTPVCSDGGQSCASCRAAISDDGQAASHSGSGYPEGGHQSRGKDRASRSRAGAGPAFTCGTRGSQAMEVSPLLSKWRAS